MPCHHASVRARRGALSIGAVLASLAPLLWVGAPAQGSEPTLDRIVSANPVNWTPNVNNGRVNGMVQVGSRIIAVGKFTSVTDRDGSSIDRASIFAFNATTGAVDDDFVPNVGGKEVFDIADGGDGTIYIGGLFSKVNGAKKTGKVARLDAATGAVISTFRAPAINGAVNDLQLSNGHLYIGGGFTSVGGQQRTLLAALNPTTGADTETVTFAFADTFNGGDLGLKHFDVSDDGASLVAVGNWRTVDGQSRPQVMVASLTARRATLADWSTQRFAQGCGGEYPTYLRDVDIAPAGDYFVTVTSGGWSGGASGGSLCDAASRWELSEIASGQEPTWVDYSGGDTFTQVKITGPVIYVGGHFRYLNNPNAENSAGDGATARTGLAALDPRNGLPFSWNPTRARGEGVWELMTTDAGLWVGHDTNRTGKEVRKRIALFPSGWSDPTPADEIGTLPGDAYLLGLTGGVDQGHWIARINVGGNNQPAIDGGPDWAADTDLYSSSVRTGESSARSFTWLAVTSDDQVPTSTPAEIFYSDRWSADDDPGLRWDFPAPVGDDLTVRLYFSNAGCTCTEAAGDRIFDVTIDGGVVLDDYDIVSDVGSGVGTMKEFEITSDGNVDLDFGHVVGDPLVSAIEIIDNDVTAPAEEAYSTVVRRVVGDDTIGSSPVQPANTASWRQARGAVMIDNTLYTGWSDGTMTMQTFDGTSFGVADSVDLKKSAAFAAELPSITGMFFDPSSGRLYYSIVGQPRLYYRYFLPESQVVGAVRFDGPGEEAGVDWRNTAGLPFDGSAVYLSSAVDGSLTRLPWDDATTGAGSVVSGPEVDGLDWRSRAMFLFVG